MLLCQDDFTPALLCDKHLALRQHCFTNYIVHVQLQGAERNQRNTSITPPPCNPPLSDSLPVRLIHFWGPAVDTGAGPFDRFRLHTKRLNSPPRPATLEGDDTAAGHTTDAAASTPARCRQYMRSQASLGFDGAPRRNVVAAPI